MPKLLIVEDEEDLQQVLKFNFLEAGFDVAVTGAGSEAIRIVRDSPPDVVLLDVMLPDILGTQVCRSIKSDPATARTLVLMLTAKGEEQDRVEGFELGADDYVTKPFSVRELLLRVNALLRRGAAIPGDSKQIVFGCLKVDVDAHRVWVIDDEVELSALEFKLLIALYERRNRVQTRASLLDGVWGVSADVTTRTVDTHVKRLREKLGSARSYIETVRGVGYRFVSKPEDAR